MFSLLNFSSIFPGGSADPIVPVCGRPWSEAKWRHCVNYIGTVSLRLVAVFTAESTGRTRRQRMTAWAERTAGVRRPTSCPRRLRRRPSDTDSILDSTCWSPPSPLMSTRPPGRRSEFLQSTAGTDDKERDVTATHAWVWHYMLLTVILTIISFPSPTHSFIPGLKPSFSANPSHTTAFPFLLLDWLHEFPGLLLLLLSMPVFTFSVFNF